MTFDLSRLLDPTFISFVIGFILGAIIVVYRHE